LPVAVHAAHLQMMHLAGDGDVVVHKWYIVRKIARNRLLADFLLGIAS
jgi:hypothetical protein